MNDNVRFRQMNEDEKIVSFMLDVSSKLGSIEAKLSSVCEGLLKHETRIATLEQKIADGCLNSSKTDLKAQIIKWMAMSLIGSMAVIITLTGSGKILSQLTMQQPIQQTQQVQQVQQPQQ